MQVVWPQTRVKFLTWLYKAPFLLGSLTSLACLVPPPLALCSLPCFILLNVPSHLTSGFHMLFPQPDLVTYLPNNSSSFFRTAFSETPLLPFLSFIEFISICYLFTLDIKLKIGRDHTWFFHCYIISSWHIAGAK